MESDPQHLAGWPARLDRAPDPGASRGEPGCMDGPADGQGLAPLRAGRLDGLVNVDVNKLGSILKGGG